MQINKLGEILVARNLVSDTRLQASLKEQYVTGEKLGKILIRNGFIRQIDLIKILSEVNPLALHEESVFHPAIPPQVLIDTRSMVTAIIGERVYVSSLTSYAILRDVLGRYINKGHLFFISVNIERLDEYLNRLRALFSETKPRWDTLLEKSLQRGASDIHIIPRSKSYTVQIRADGVLHILHEGTLDEYYSITSRIKDLSRMDMAEKRRPQDGGFTLDYNGRVINFRTVTVPTMDGERVVIRLLDPDKANLPLEALGITRLSEWRKGFACPEGICLICGPTGSGKTTTLNSTLREINFMERSVYTIEDPVEYTIPYAGQVSVNPTVNLSFSEAVRNFMRADPDVIVIGEVRDLETARNAIRAAETGHLVIATLHTASILGAVSRLRDLGIQPFELRHILRSVLVQRLVRTLCPACEGKSCPQCLNGYKGRQVVSEVNYFRGPSDVDAVIDGIESWPSIMSDALSKARTGITNLAEVERVFGQKIIDQKAIPYLTESSV